MEGKATEWDEWRDGVREDFIHSASTTEDASRFAQNLAWLGRRLKPEALNISWTSEEQARWLQRCGECTEWGSKTDYFHDNITVSMRWADAVIANKGKPPDNIVAAQDTVAALVSALEKDAVCQEALVALRIGGADVKKNVALARDAAEEERQFTLDKARRYIKGNLSSPKQTKTPAADKLKAAREAAEAAASGGGGGRLAGVSGNKRGTRTKAKTGTETGHRGDVPRPAQFAEPKLPTGLSVIVVGAGVSGLHAALLLERMGARVTVLEGRDRIGGRIRSEKLGLSLPPDQQRVVDLGASFVCGTSVVPPMNPMFQYAHATLGLTLQPKHRDGPQGNAWFDVDGRRLAPEAGVGSGF